MSSKRSDVHKFSSSSMGVTIPYGNDSVSSMDWETAFGRDWHWTGIEDFELSCVKERIFESTRFEKRPFFKKHDDGKRLGFEKVHPMHITTIRFHIRSMQSIYMWIDWKFDSDFNARVLVVFGGMTRSDAPFEKKKRQWCNGSISLVILKDHEWPSQFTSIVCTGHNYVQPWNRRWMVSRRKRNGETKVLPLLA